MFAAYADPAKFPAAAAAAAGGFPRCALCGGALRPLVTFFGEPLAPEFARHQDEDFAAATLLLVMGTTLAVYPFAALAGKASLLTPRLLLNREATGPFREPDAAAHAYRDVAWLGSIDDGVAALAALLGLGSCAGTGLGAAAASAVPIPCIPVGVDVD